MRLSRAFMILLLILAAMTTSTAQTPATALCDGIVARIRSAPQEDAWSVLTKGNPPFIDVSGEDEWKSLDLDNARDDAEVVNRLISRFNPSDPLRKAWSKKVEDPFRAHLELHSLAASDLHVLTTTDGRALCMDFMIFNAPKNRQAQLLPDLPLKSDRDGDNLICIKYGGDAYLARVDGVEAFLETHTTDTTNYYRVVPLKDGAWSKACAVDVDFGTTYTTSKAFALPGGPIREADLKTVASQIVEKRNSVKDAKDFSFGPPISEREQAKVGTMMDLDGKLQDKAFPAFGREKELAAGEETLTSGDSFPIVLNGTAYWLRMGLEQLGCCFFRGPLLIFYDLKEGKLEPVGSAVVEKGRGAMQSIRATPSR